MSKQLPFGLIAGSILLALSPLSLLAGELPQANPLQGHWVFNIPETVEAGLQIAGRALEEFGLAPELVRDRLASEREGVYKQSMSKLEEQSAE